jgi:hypothetical protein
MDIVSNEHNNVIAEKYSNPDYPLTPDERKSINELKKNVFRGNTQQIKELVNSPEDNYEIENVPAFGFRDVDGNIKTAVNTDLAPDDHADFVEEHECVEQYLREHPNRAKQLLEILKIEIEEKALEHRPEHYVATYFELLVAMRAGKLQEQIDLFNKSNTKFLSSIDLEEMPELANGLRVQASSRDKISKLLQTQN